MTQLGELSVVEAAGPKTLRLTGEFDLSNNHELEHALTAAIGAGARDLIVDLRDVSFLDGTTVNTLVLARKRSARRNGQIVLVRPPSPVWRVFVLTGMSRAFAAFDSPESAARYLAG
jgi:anti-sigma B factor antagonist